MVLLSGSFLSIAFNGRKAVSYLPVTVMSIIFLLYLFGVFGALPVGFYVVNALVAIIYGFFLVRLFKKKDVRTALLRALPGLGIVAAVYLLLNYCDKGLLAHNFDEFNHWADVVKIMTGLDDFATNPMSDSWYKSYPPATALLQYYLQKLVLLNKGNSFVEWRLYLAYHCFLLSLFAPAIDEDRMTVFQKASVLLISIVTPLFFFKYTYDALMVDVLISILGGITISDVAFSKDKDACYYARVILSVGMLTLLKDVGLVFSAVIIFFLLVDELPELLAKFREGNKKAGCNRLLPVLSPALLTAFFKLTWNSEIKRGEIVANFSGKIDFKLFLQMLISKNGDDYRQEVVNSAVSAFFERNFNVLFFEVSYMDMLLIFGAGLVAAFAVLFIKKEYGKSAKYWIYPITILVLMVGYAVFIAAMYAFKFGKNEALNLASYDRYMNIPYLFMLIVVLNAVRVCLSDSGKRTVGLAILVYCLLLFVDTTPLSDFVGRKNVEKSIAYRSEYDLIVQTIENNCSEGARVYFVSENDEGLDLRIVRYSVRPVSVANVIKESRIATLPKSKKITPEEWMNTLIEGNFDYVAIHSVDEALGRDFGQCFENVDDIQPDTIFYLDKDRRLLVRCSG